jgi:hypothetical protein
MLVSAWRTMPCCKVEEMYSRRKRAKGLSSNSRLVSLSSSSFLFSFIFSLFFFVPPSFFELELF